MFVHPIFSQIGGAERITRDLFKECKSKHDVRLYTLFYSNFLRGLKDVNYVSDKDARFSNIFGSKINPFNLNLIKKLAKKVADDFEDGDKIIYTNFPGSLIVHYAQKINSKIKDINYMCFEPDRILYYDENIKYNFLPTNIQDKKYKLASKIFSAWKKIDMRVVRNSNKVFSMSETVLEQTNRIYEFNKCFKAFEYYVDIREFEDMSIPDARHFLNRDLNLNLKDDDLIFIVMSRLEKSKGFIELFDILEKINNKEGKLPFKLLISGNGSLKDFVEKKSEEFDNVEFLGHVDNKFTLLSAGNAFLFLGQKETGGPLVLLEAMLAKNFAISSNQGGPIEIVVDGKNGLFVDVENTENCADVMLDVVDMFKINKAKFDEISIAGQNDVKKYFLLSKALNDFEKNVLNS